jgi:mRNA-degrading endonuclease RelE of RelBE toxin-antitoxin system
MIIQINAKKGSNFENKKSKTKPTKDRTERTRNSTIDSIKSGIVKIIAQIKKKNKTIIFSDFGFQS